MSDRYGSLADVLGLDERDSRQITTKSCPRNPSCSSLETKAVRDEQLDQAVLSRDRGFQIVAPFRRTDPDLAAVQAAEFRARSAHIVERHVAQVRDQGAVAATHAAMSANGQLRTVSKS